MVKTREQVARAAPMGQAFHQAIAELNERFDRLEEQRVNISLPSIRADQDFFHGTALEDVDTFLDRFGRYAQANGWGMDRQRRMLPTFLRGRAEIWFRNLDE